MTNHTGPGVAAVTEEVERCVQFRPERPSASQILPITYFGSYCYVECVQNPAQRKRVDYAVIYNCLLLRLIYVR